MKFKEIRKRLQSKKSELQEIESELEVRKSELQALKTEIIELSDFINSKFEEEFKEYDYKVDITKCYIVAINGKKYIALKNCEKDYKESSTVSIVVETYRYYDVLNVNNNKYKLFYSYIYGHNGFFERLVGNKPDYEKHILEVCPELSIFIDNKVPNTYLKKIYYEVNDLWNKKLIK